MGMSEHDLGAVHCPLMFHGTSDSRSQGVERGRDNLLCQ